MTTPRDINTNQEDNMRELIATQNQLSQETTQLLANNNGLDPAIQRILKLQSQLLQGLVTQMINMRENFSQRANDNKDDKDVILEGTKACNICGDKDHTSKEHGDQCPNCEKKHPTNQCPTSQVTRFLCEGNDHAPIQCPIYPIVQQMKQDGMHQMFGNLHKGTTSTKMDEGKVRTIPHKVKSKV